MAREPFNRIWTETPTVDDFDEPTEAMWDAGWRGGAAEDPPEAFAQNWWQNRVDFALQDLEREGAMEWLSTVPYEMWAFARGSDGEVYIAIQSNDNVDPTTDDGTKWLSIPDYIRSLFSAQGNAPMFAIRAWGNFGGIGSATLNAGGNVSVSRISNGRYQVTFTVAMQDSNYSVSGSVVQDSTSGSVNEQDGFTPYDYQVSGFKIETRTGPLDVGDVELINFQVVR